MTRLALTAVLLAMLAGGGSGCRQSGPALLVAEGPLTIERLASVLEAGDLATRVFDERSLALSTPEGYHLIVFIEDDGSSLQALFPCVRRGDMQAMGSLAAWNANRRFSRAYRDEDGRPVMAADLVLDEATTAQQVSAWGELLLAMAEVFMAEVWPPVPSDSTIPQPQNE